MFKVDDHFLQSNKKMISLMSRTSFWSFFVRRLKSKKYNSKCSYVNI